MSWFVACPSQPPARWYPENGGNAPQLVENLPWRQTHTHSCLNIFSINFNTPSFKVFFLLIPSNRPRNYDFPIYGNNSDVFEIETFECWIHQQPRQTIFQRANPIFRFQKKRYAISRCFRNKKNVEKCFTHCWTMFVVFSHMKRILKNSKKNPTITNINNI